MKIIVDGPDGGGKSTLAVALQGVGFTRVRCVPDVKGMHEDRHVHSDLFWWYADRLLDYSRATTDLVIERCYLSEEVYGPIMRGVNRLGAYGREYLDMLVAQHEIVTVFCLPPWPVTLKNWQFKRREKWDPEKRTGDYVDAESKLQRIHQAYGQEFGFAEAVGTPGLAFYYDYTVKKVPQLLQQINERRARHVIKSQ